MLILCVIVRLDEATLKWTACWVDDRWLYYNICTGLPRVTLGLSELERKECKVNQSLCMLHYLCRHSSQSSFLGCLLQSHALLNEHDHRLTYVAVQRSPTYWVHRIVKAVGVILRERSKVLSEAAQFVGNRLPCLLGFTSLRRMCIATAIWSCLPPTQCGNVWFCRVDCVWTCLNECSLVWTWICSYVCIMYRCERSCFEDCVSVYVFAAQKTSKVSFMHVFCYDSIQCVL